MLAKFVLGYYSHRGRGKVIHVWGPFTGSQIKYMCVQAVKSFINGRHQLDKGSLSLLITGSFPGSFECYDSSRRARDGTGESAYTPKRLGKNIFPINHDLKKLNINYLNSQDHVLPAIVTSVFWFTNSYKFYLLVKHSAVSFLNKWFMWTGSFCVSETCNTTSIVKFTNKWQLSLSFNWSFKKEMIIKIRI